MRRAVRLLLVGAVAGALLAEAVADAVADEVTACWVEERLDPVLQTTQTVTVCRLAGSVVDYGSEGEVPSVLHPDVGTAAGVQCWFWTSRTTQWVIIVRNPDGSAVLGWDPDTVPGGPVAVDTFAPVCTSEPTPGEPDELAAWRVIQSYVNARPDPVLDPPPPRGLAGLETRLGVGVPEPFATRLVSPGTGRPLDVEASVFAVRIDWGDGTVDTHPHAVLPLLTGWPDGAAGHVYEVKTCSEPGDRCHPELDAYPLVVGFEWFARWRVAGGDWQPIAVPVTETAVDYPVSEVVGTLTDGS